jgi:tetratricopeptide (TPR) repeat protein
VKIVALVVALAVATAATPVEAQPGSPITPEQALEKIGNGNPETRRTAAPALGDLGTMADAPVLLKALRDPDEGVRAVAEGALWQVWSRSGDPEIDALFQLGVEQMSRGDAKAAIQTFTVIVQKLSEFAEGWNKRATIYYLVGEYEKSLEDCDEVVKRNPQHWGVLAGYGQIYLALDKPELALDYFQRALKVNPNLRSVETAVEELKQVIIEKRKGTI